MLLILSSPAAYAEVSDKIPSVLELWTQGVVLGLFALFLARWNVWAAVVGLLIGSLLIYGSYELLADPFVGPAATREQGEIYRLHSYGSAVLVILLSFVGAVLGWRRRRVR